MNKNWLYFFLLGFVVLASCKPDEECPDDNTTYDPTPYELQIPDNLPEMVIPADNPMTEEGVELGRKLFYEPLLSGDNTMSCATCHNQQQAFTDNGNQFSTGIDGLEGNRNAMAIINLGYGFEFFWDGRSASLEEQALRPVPNPIEMHDTWENVVGKLQATSEYPPLFQEAFGTDQIDSMLVAKAIAQFERTLISGNSKFDKFRRFETSLSESEARGFAIFSSEQGDCFHCHNASGGLFTDNLFHNNGLDSVFPDDKGLEEFTNDPNDRGKFKTPTLRNIELTAPYMHDGRFQTLEEVVEHYNMGGHPSPTIDPLMKNVGTGLQLSVQEKQDLVAFMKTLTDEEFINNPDFSDPN